MKLLDAISLVANSDPSIDFVKWEDENVQHILTARQFLYGNNPTISKEVISPEAIALVNSHGLTGDDFHYMDYGTSATVYGNDKIVFRLQNTDRDYQTSGALALNEIPEGLTTIIYDSGECNGVAYRMAERLITNPRPESEEIIPFLFRLREMDLVYSDTTNANFGYTVQHELKILDHDHFYPLEKSQQNFYASLSEALPDFKGMPALTSSDSKNTYIIFNDISAGTAAEKNLQKHLLASLNTVGISPDEIEIIDKPSIIRISRMEISYGTPPRSEKLTDYVEASLDNYPKKTGGGPENTKNDVSPGRS